MRYGCRVNIGKGRLARRAMSGQATREFALGTLIFVLTVMGLLEGGRLAFTVPTLQHAVHEGSRAAALRSTTETAVKQKVATAASAIGLLTTSVTVQVNGGGTLFTGRATGDTAAVTATYTHATLFAPLAGVSSFTLSRQAVSRVE